VIEKKQHQQQEGKKYANPFTYDTPIDTYEKIKIFWMCLLGIPLLRFILLVIIFFFILFFGRLGVFGWNPFNHTNPTQKRQRLPKWRRFLLGPLPFLIRMALFVIGFYSIPVKFPKSKSDTLRKLPRIIISNHISFLDGFFFAFFCFPSIAMKKELQEIPLIGRIFLAFEAIFIDRSSAEGRKKAFQDIQDQLNDSFFPPLLIFPEGTTSNQKFLTQFKVGSFGSGFSCQPGTVIQYCIYNRYFYTDDYYTIYIYIYIYIVVIRYPFQHFDVSWTPSISARTSVHL
jgi:lysophosphatidylcholine acyltransferase/lyso-PAF acetyltransferase